MSRRQARVGLAVGLALLIGAPVLWLVTKPEPAGQTVTTVQSSAAEALTEVVSTASTALPSAQSASPSAPSFAAITPGSTSVTAEPPPAPIAVPVSIQVPALGIDAVVVPVGVDGDGAMEIPVDVTTVGWYKFGPAPGDTAGSAVLTGHVDSREQGRGTFAAIGDLAPGDAVTVTDETGAVRNFTVIAREEWSKDETPLDRIFDRGGSPRLVLITCGGDFDASIGHYDDNIAITAIPVD